MMAEAAAEAKPLTPFTPMPNPIWHYGGYCSPFDLSAAFLFVGLFIMTALWGENYGSSDVSDLCKDFQTPVEQMKDDTSIPLAGTVISLFEGSMYIFVFNWTPALSAGSKTTPPFGLIFSIFMVACMGGSSLFAIAIKRISAGKLLSFVFLFASVALALPLLTSGLEATLISFLLFEACVPSTGRRWGLCARRSCP